jgi:hypothetical protein
MKKSILAFVIMLSAGWASAQCNEFYLLEKGTEWEMESYNAKDKKTGRSYMKVKDIEGNAKGYVANVLSVLYDEKGKVMHDGELEFSCKDGTMYIDMRRYLNDEQMKSFGQMDMEITSENLEFPNKLSVGQVLKDASITMAIKGSMPMKFTTEIVERKVEGKETITTPAGTFECYKISSKTRVKSIMSAEYKSVEWVALKVGTVRSESYNRGGKLTGYTILTKRN